MGSDMRQRTRFENASLEAIEATLDPNFVPEGWLDPLPLTPLKKKLKLSLVERWLELRYKYCTLL